MKEPIGPVRRISDRRSNDRRAKERRDAERRLQRERAEASSRRLPVPVERPAPQADAKPAEAAFAAQLMGQKGQKRGLKGGPPALEEARSAYLGAEWSGPDDRRKRLGRIAKTEI